MIWGQQNNDEKLKQLLKKSGNNFQFDPTQVKYRLLTSMDETDQKPKPHFHFTRVAKYSVGFAGTVIFLSATMAVASNSRPGDKLFALNKFGEQVVLNLPLSVEQKAKVEAYIVTNRLQALDQVQTKQAQTKVTADAKNLATIKETDESFATAVNEISVNKVALEAKGNTKDADKLEQLLDRLQAQAQLREAMITNMGDTTTSADIKLEIQAHLSQMRTSQKKARAQIKRFQKDPVQKADNSGVLEIKTETGN